MWKQQKRVWDNRGGYSDPFVGRPIHISLLDDRPSSSGEGGTPAQSGPEMIALYGPPPRNNESTHLGASLTNPGTASGGDDDDGFEGVLDLYIGAVQGSILSAELELAVGGDTGVEWRDASALEVSIGRTASGSPSLPETSGPRIRTLAEYKQVIKMGKARSLLEEAVPKEEPPPGIEWSYSACGYATGRLPSHNINQNHPPPPRDPTGGDRWISVE